VGPTERGDGAYGVGSRRPGRRCFLEHLSGAFAGGLEDRLTIEVLGCSGPMLTPESLANVGVWRETRRMEVTAAAVDQIPRRNLRVSRDAFVALWRLAEHLGEVRPGDWYVAGVAATCEWLAGSAVPSILGGWELARAPLTRRARVAHEELIAAELMAAEVAAIGNPGGLEGRPGWLEGILATLRWAWSGSTEAPLEVPSTSTG
jgi:hypothetical protein